ENVLHVGIGGVEPGAGNVIAYNQFGIKGLVSGSNHPGSVLSNSIHGNTYLAYSLGGAGGDLGWARGNWTDFRSDPGPNYPVLASARSANGEIIISGYLNSRAEETFLLQFFSNLTVEVSGFGQGETLIGSDEVTTDGVGHAEFSFTFPG